MNWKKWLMATGAAAVTGAIGAAQTADPLNLAVSGKQVIGGAALGALLYLMNPNKQKTTETTVVDANITTQTIEKKVE